MLPETKDGKDLFFSMREQRNRWRQWTIELNEGGAELLKFRAMQALALDADLSSLREQVEFMVSEGMLTPDQLEAAQNCFGWGAALLATIPGEAR